MARGKAYYQKRARMYARGAGIDPNLFVRQIQQESGFQTQVTSHAGAQGIAQIVPRWHPGVNPRNPEASLKYAAQHMANLKKKYGNYQDALSVYNSGRPWKIGQGINETQNYVKKIMGGWHPAGGAAPGPGRENLIASAAPGSNTTYGGTSARPRALANFMLGQAQRTVAGEAFDLAGMTAAARADKAFAVNDMMGMDPGGQDAADPRVRMEETVPLRGGNASAAMRTMIKQARKMGLSVSGNIAATGRPETSGHTSGSDHYKFLDKKTQAAIDVSGDPKQELAYYRWLSRNSGRLRVKDTFHDPAGYSFDEGRRINSNLAPGHGHVHASVRR